MRNIILIVIFFLFLSPEIRSEEKKDKTEPKPTAQQTQSGTQSSTPSAKPAPSPPGPSQAEIQRRVKELIELINLEPNLLAVNPKAKVIKPEDWKPYTPDGKYNQDFKVVPDDSAPELSQALNIEQNRQKWTEELIKIGAPAVPELVKAVLDDGKKYRHFYIMALGQIKDLKATPAILKYYQDALAQETMAKVMEQIGATDDAKVLREESNFRKGYALSALKNLSGKDFGDDYAKWEQWWKETEKKIGPVELPKLFEVKGTKQNASRTFQPVSVQPAPTSGTTAK